MSYGTVATIAEDVDVINRVSACAATRGVRQPVGWVSPRSWVFASKTGWAEAYESVVGLSENPGLDINGISDDMILSAVIEEMSVEGI